MTTTTTFLVTSHLTDTDEAERAMVLTEDPGGFLVFARAPDPVLPPAVFGSPSQALRGLALWAKQQGHRNVDTSPLLTALLTNARIILED